MAKKNAPKLIFILLALAAIIFSRMVYPTISLPQTGLVELTPNGSAAKSNSLLILPSLSANASTQGDGSLSSMAILDGQTAELVSGSMSNITKPSGINPPGLTDAETLIANLNSGVSYLSVNANERWPLASVSKLMTAVVATDLLPMDKKVTITPSMTAVDPTEGILQIGDTYTVEDLLHVMLLPSNNVAAESLAEAYGRTAFLAAMNAKAQSWGMTNTYYDDPSGLSAANESTADDLLKLAQNIYTSYPQILAITRMPTATVMNYALNKTVTVKSINDFAGQSDFLGGKTGYTDEADGNLLSLFSNNGNPILIVVMGIDDKARFDGTQELYNWFKMNFTS
jgi:D-alanyl-D-alanine carboxypeptidase